jgi:hypothetical protein
LVVLHGLDQLIGDIGIVVQHGFPFGLDR